MYYSSWHQYGRFDELRWLLSLPLSVVVCGTILESEHDKVLGDDQLATG